jgi:ADP-ribosyl-[dinitrogen reductase] hydrolase
MTHVVSQARITHNHPLSDGASVLVAQLIQLALIGHAMDRLQRQVDRAVLTFPQFNYRRFNGLSTAYVVDTMQTVLHFLFSTSSFEDCIVATVNQGGDADTTGAIVGAIAGAYYGLDAIPRDWIRKLDPQVRDELDILAEQLVDASPLAHGDPVTLVPPPRGADL